jgi:hypothetical protein
VVKLYCSFAFITLRAILQLLRVSRNLFPKVRIDFGTKAVTVTLLDMNGVGKHTKRGRLLMN